MINIQLKGGFGNQLYQYVFGRVQSIRLQNDLSFDTFSYELDKLRNLELSAVISKLDIRRVENDLLTRISRKIGISPKWQYVYELEFGFNKDILNMIPASRNIYFQGYWQSYKYFEDSWGIIEKDFSFPDVPSNLVPCLQKIKGVNSVAIHIRRGDYITNSSANSLHGVLSLDYFKDAIELISKEETEIEFFVFSDDIDWCRANLKCNSEINYLPKEDSSTLTDFVLMMNCSHQIISNSTFSWWAAWMNKNENKKVIAPQKWFANKKIDLSLIYPKSWEVI